MMEKKRCWLVFFSFEPPFDAFFCGCLNDVLTIEKPEPFCAPIFLFFVLLPDKPLNSGFPVTVY